jgi:DNA-binding HxlR family transcriptional regulator
MILIPGSAEHQSLRWVVHWDDVGSQVCSIARTMSVLGDRWTMLVVREAFIGTKTFDEFVAYTGAAPQVVSARLKRLLEAGVLKKEPVADGRSRSEYLLSEMGQDLYPVVCTIMVWGDRWLSDGRGRPHALRHTGCGCVTSPKLACDACGEFVSRKTLKGEPSPSMKRYRAQMFNEASQ